MLLHYVEHVTVIRVVRDMYML